MQPLHLFYQTLFRVIESLRLLSTPKTPKTVILKERCRVMRRYHDSVIQVINNLSKQGKELLHYLSLRAQKVINSPNTVSYIALQYQIECHVYKAWKLYQPSKSDLFH